MSMRAEIQQKIGSLKASETTTQPIQSTDTTQTTQPINACAWGPPTLYHANWRNAVRLRIKCSCLRSEIGYQGRSATSDRDRAFAASPFGRFHDIVGAYMENHGKTSLSV